MNGFHCVVADNRGAHNFAGFVENLSGKYVCRFCMAENVDIQTKEVKSASICVRSKDIHNYHLKSLEDHSVDNHFGV